MNRLVLIFTMAVFLGLAGCTSRTSSPGSGASLPVAETGGSAKGDFGPPQGEPIHAVLTSPPNVPPPIHRDHPAKVIVELERDREGDADLRGRDLHVLDVRRHRARQLHPRAPGRHGRVPPASNDPANKMPHNIDLHGVTGPGGGAASQLHRAGPRIAVHVQGAQPGPLRLSLRDRAGRHARRQRHVRPDPGRAARRPAPGRSRVLRDAGRLLHDRQVPREGPAALRHGEGDRRAADVRAVQRRRGLADRRQGADAPRPARRVRLFVGNGGPNLVSSFHVIGEIFDRVQQRRRHASAGERADHADPRRRRGHRRVPHRGAGQLRPRRPLDLPRVQQGRARDPQGRAGRRTSRSTPARKSTRSIWAIEPAPICKPSARRRRRMPAAR